MEWKHPNLTRSLHDQQSSNTRFDNNSQSNVLKELVISNYSFMIVSVSPRKKIAVRVN